MKRGKGDRERRWHVTGGFPGMDDDCPICRAHGIDPEVEGLQIQELSLEQILRCPCPMCTNARIEPLDN